MSRTVLLLGVLVHDGRVYTLTGCCLHTFDLSHGKHIGTVRCAPGSDWIEEHGRLRRIDANNVAGYLSIVDGTVHAFGSRCHTAVVDN